MKIKTKLATILVVLISTLFLAGCDYQIDRDRYPVYPHDKVFPNVPDGTYHFQTAIDSCKYWQSNDKAHTISINLDKNLFYLDGNAYGYDVLYTNQPMVVNVTLHPASTAILLKFELTHAYKQSIKIIDSNIPELEQEFRGILK